MSFFKRLFGKPEEPQEDKSTQNDMNAASVSATVVRCPYCSEALEKKPSRKTKCPHCGNAIYVQKGRLLTEKEQQRENFVSTWVRKLQNSGFDFTAEDFESEERALQRQFGRTGSWNDVIWGVLNRLSAEAEEHVDRMSIYMLMADVLVADGKDSSEFRALAAKEQLAGIASERVEVRTVNDEQVCENCRRLDGQVFTIEEALSELPVPHRCTSPRGCRCYYVPVVDDE